MNQLSLQHFQDPNNLRASGFYSIGKSHVGPLLTVGPLYPNLDIRVPDFVWWSGWSGGWWWWMTHFSGNSLYQRA